MPDTSLHIEGMTCGACAARVDRALRNVPGVREAAVNLTTGLAAVSGDAQSELLLQAVDRAGYNARVLAGGAAGTLKSVTQRGMEEEARVWRRLMLGFLFGIPAVAIDLMIGHQVWLAQHFSAALDSRYVMLEAALATLAMAFAGWPFFAGAWRALRHGHANMDVLVALGSGVAYVASIVTMFRPGGMDVGMAGIEGKALEFAAPPMLEFHAAVTIVVLVTLGKYLEARAKRRAAAGVAGLAAGTAATAARVALDGTIEIVPAESIAIRDCVQVLAHQSVPVDGEVIEGGGTADLSVVTGESLPVEVREGASLPSGAVLADGRVVLRATATAGESTVARILELVNAAQASKTEIQALADRVAGIFVPIILVLAALNFAAWLLIGGGWEKALVTTIATIVIACPCAMGLATPTAITVAMGTAARAGILFTQARALEIAGKIGTVAFDKTGTLTEGKPRVATVGPFESSAISVKDLLLLAASVEQYSEHPLAKAIVAAALKDGLTLIEPVSFSSVPGGGVRAAFADGRELAAGSATFLTTLGVNNDRQSFIEGFAARGQTVVAIADVRAGQVLGVIGLADGLRADALTMMNDLKARGGFRVVVLSGDTQAAVEGTLGRLKEVDIIKAQVKPQEKAAILEALKRDGHGGVAFVGDGINDAPALAAADLGIAMASGTDLAKMAGDILLTGNRLTAVPEAIELSRRTLRIIRQNLFWAFAYNVAAIPLAMLGILPPGVAAAAMVLSSLTVVGNALRLHRRL